MVLLTSSSSIERGTNKLMNKLIWCTVIVYFSLVTDVANSLSKKYSEMPPNEKISFLQRCKDISNFNAVKNELEKAKIFLNNETHFQNWMQTQLKELEVACQRLAQQASAMQGMKQQEQKWILNQLEKISINPKIASIYRDDEFRRNVVKAASLINSLGWLPGDLVEEYQGWARGSISITSRNAYFMTDFVEPIVFMAELSLRKRSWVIVGECYEEKYMHARYLATKYAIEFLIKRYHDNEEVKDLLNKFNENWKCHDENYSKIQWEYEAFKDFVNEVNGKISQLQL